MITTQMPPTGNSATLTVRASAAADSIADDMAIALAIFNELGEALRTWDAAQVRRALDGAAFNATEQDWSRARPGRRFRLRRPGAVDAARWPGATLVLIYAADLSPDTTPRRLPLLHHDLSDDDLRALNRDDTKLRALWSNLERDGLARIGGGSIERISHGDPT